MKRKLLFVDDEVLILDGLRRVLQRQRGLWEMTFATSVQEALDAVSDANFDAIISDVNIPGKNGFDLLMTLGDSERTKDIPTIIVTGLNDKGLKKHALDLGAADVLSKPIDTEELLARINSVLRLKSYQDQIKSQNEVLEQKVKERTGELEDSRLDILWCLGNAAEFRDQETGNHVIRVGCSSKVVAHELRQGDDFADLLFLASPLHDIGKIGIPDHILLKKGPLSHQEWEIMKQHCVIGARILRGNSKLLNTCQRWRKPPFAPGTRQAENPLLGMASSIALTHHEKWDGTGYPSALAGEAIPLESRIVTLVDAYDALRSDRPYRAGRSQQESLDIIQEGVGRHFDPDVHPFFEKSISEIEVMREHFSDELRDSAHEESSEATDPICRG